MAIERGGFRPHKDMGDAHIVVDGQTYQWRDITEEMLSKVMKRYEHAKEAHVRRAHQIDYVMSRTRRAKGREV